MDQIPACRMSPVHMGPFLAMGIKLIEHVVISLKPAQPIGIIDPVLPRCKMICLPDRGIVPVRLPHPYKSAVLILFQIADAFIQDILTSAQIADRDLAFFTKDLILRILLHRDLNPFIRGLSRRNFLTFPIIRNHTDASSCL